MRASSAHTNTLKKCNKKRHMGFMRAYIDCCTLSSMQLRHPSSLSLVSNLRLSYRLLRPVHFLETALHAAPVPYSDRDVMMNSLCSLLSAADHACNAQDHVSDDENDRGGPRAVRTAQRSYNRLNRAIHDLGVTWERVQKDMEARWNDARDTCIHARSSLTPTAKCSIIGLMGPVQGKTKAFARRVRSAVYLVQRSVFRVACGTTLREDDASFPLLFDGRRGS